MYYTTWDAGFCTLFIAGNNLEIRRLGVFEGDKNTLPEEIENYRFIPRGFPEAKQQLAEYFSGKRMQFQLTLRPEGSTFQKKVWQALLQIPYGETRSYKEIAEQIGSPQAARAVGGANNKNPIPIIIPCHRVIAASGKLRGYAYGLELKRKLIDLENRNKHK